MKDEMLQIRLGAKIRRLRENACLTQAELALTCDVSAPRLSLIENGKVDVRLSTLARIVETLGMEIGDLPLAEPQLIPAVEILERRSRNRARLQSSAIGLSDPIARLDRKDRLGRDTTAERSLLRSN